MLLHDSERRASPFRIANEIRLTPESLTHALNVSKSLQPSPWNSFYYATPPQPPVGVRQSFRRGSSTSGTEVRTILGSEQQSLLNENGECSEERDYEASADWWSRFSCRNMQTVLSCIVILVFAMIAVIILVLLVPLSTNAINLVNQFDSAAISDHIDAVFEHTLSASLRAEAAASYMLNASKRTSDLVDSAAPALGTAITAGNSLAVKAKAFSEHPLLTIGGG